MSQIVSSMRHRKSAYSSLVLEVALGCTVVAYALGLGRGLREVSGRPLGFDVDRTFVVTFEEALEPEHGPRAQREIEQLRRLPGVQAAAWVELPPLSHRELPETVMTASGAQLVWALRGDAGLAAALGMQLGQGRWLTPQDAERGGPTPVLVTRALGARLGSDPIGATLSSPGLGSMSVVGVIDGALRLNPFYQPGSEIVLAPVPPLQARRTSYLALVTRAASADFAQLASGRLRPAAPTGSVQIERLADRRGVFLRNIGGADTIILITVLGMVLVVLVGSIGMASSLIVERTRQIGIRRALGARRADIVGYFMLENLFATLLGLLIGAGLCILLDHALAPVRGPMHVAWREFLPVAAALFLATGQVSVLLPARRAACGAPCIMARAA
jgi:putative ABC transport system permease protein